MTDDVKRATKEVQGEGECKLAWMRWGLFIVN